MFTPYRKEVSRPMSVRIRRAGFTDAPAVAEIYVETWREAYPGMLPDRVLLGMSSEHQRRAWRHSICGRRGRRHRPAARNPGRNREEVFSWGWH